MEREQIEREEEIKELSIKMRRKYELLLFLCIDYIEISLLPQKNLCAKFTIDILVSLDLKKKKKLSNYNISHVLVKRRINEKL